MTEPARALLPMVNVEDVCEDIRRTLYNATMKGYQDPNFLRILAHQPELLRRLLSFTRHFMFAGEIEHRLIELVRLKIAQLNACHF
jgi:alkylhydroperoxidase family enzyme